MHEYKESGWRKNLGLSNNFPELKLYQVKTITFISLYRILPKLSYRSKHRHGCPNGEWWKIWNQLSIWTHHQTRRTVIQNQINRHDLTNARYESRIKILEFKSRQLILGLIQDVVRAREPNSKYSLWLKETVQYLNSNQRIPSREIKRETRKCKMGKDFMFTCKTDIGLNCCILTTMLEKWPIYGPGRGKRTNPENRTFKDYNRP